MSKLCSLREILVYFGVLFTLMGCGTSSSDSSKKLIAEVNTNLGMIKTEYAKGDQVLSFRGIPYAKPPIGQLRFAAPQSIDAYESAINATEFGSACPQQESLIEGASFNEDCLFLNVYTPDIEGSYPVMVWVHGGAFVSGSGGQVYDANRLVEQGVVVVTFNYRIGALGFLTHDAVGSGNWGLLDQQMAMQWVRDHISHFGGNADNVTLFGESAGGHSVMSQLASPGASGLFDKAIVQSGAFVDQQWSLSTSGQIGGAIASELSCTGTGIAECLRTASVESILEAQEQVLGDNSDGAYFPVVDGVILPDSFGNRIVSGNFNQVPVMTGSTSNEGRFFTAVNEGLAYNESLEAGASMVDAALAAPLTSLQEYQAAVSNLLAADSRDLNVDSIAQHYLDKQNSEDTKKYSLALSAIQTDWQFACPMLNLSYEFAEHVTTYTFRFSDQDAPSIVASSLLPISGFEMGAAHGFDVQYLLGTEDVMRNRGGGDAQIQLSEAMIQYWTKFASAGQPNSEGSSLTNWEAFDLVDETQFILELSTPNITASSNADFATTHSCEYWSSAPVNPI